MSKAYIWNIGIVKDNDLLPSLNITTRETQNINNINGLNTIQLKQVG